MKNEQSMNPDDQLRAENNYLKLKMMAEFGTEFLEEEGSESLDPAIENAFLKNIHAFELQHKMAESRKVYDALGRPDYKAADTLKPEEVGEQLKLIMGIMEKNGICLDMSAEYDDNTIYRFITEELFEHESMIVTMPGMMHHFIYEEFHPNHSLQVEEKAFDFLKRILTKEYESEYNSCQILDSTDKITDFRRLIDARIVGFQDQWADIHINELEVASVILDEEGLEAKVTIDCSYEAFSIIKGNLNFEGTAIISLRYESDYWFISGIDFPGF